MTSKKTTTGLTQPEPTTSAMTKQVGELPPADAEATAIAQGTAKPSNEAQTGVTEYTVNDGFNVRARGRVYPAGSKVPLGAKDAARLVEQGRIAPNSAGRTDSPLATLLDGNAPDVIEEIGAGEMSAEDLDQLEQLENAGKGRKTVLEAIESARAGAE